MNRLTERNTHFNSRAHAVHQVGCGTRNCAVVQGGKVAAHGNRLSAERILAVIQSGRHHAVRDQDNTVLKQPEGRANDRRMHMHAVRDEFNRHVIVVKGRTDNARCPMRKRRHGVVQVGHLPGSVLEGFAGGVVIRCRVRNRDTHLACQLVDRLHRTGQLGCQIAHLKQPLLAFHHVHKDRRLFPAPGGTWPRPAHADKRRSAHPFSPRK